MANKKESLSVNLSKLILTVSIIVSLGALVGAVGYLVSQKPIVVPIINNFIKKEIKVIVSTDKTEYEQGEIIKITLESNTNFDYFKIYWPYYTILKKENGEWKDVIRESCLCPDIKCKMDIPSPKDFSKSLIMNEEWDQKIVDCDNEGDKLGEQAEAEAGIYMISVEIPAYANNGFNVFYSNEFTIKEKTAQNQDVSVVLDKTEYLKGEPVKITITNNRNEPIYISPYDAFPSAYFISRFIDNKWQRVSQNCQCENRCVDGTLMPCPQYSMPAPYFRELKSPFSTEWKQTECVSNENQKCGAETYAAVADGQVQTGKYKVEFCYWNKKDIDLEKMVDFAPQDKKVCISNEFAIIKEKSAIDPRCGQKVKITGTCEGKLIDDIGYQFNSEIGKCIEKVVGGNGCRVETPFNSLEECQKVCENSAEECEIDSDCASCGSGCASLEMSQKDICHIGLELNECVCVSHKCIKKEKNCDLYEMPMTEKQIKECTCVLEGYKKFYRLSGAYCATNSQKPCSVHADCPKGERCISRDKKNWFCTGQFAGCFYRNPEDSAELCED